MKIRQIKQNTALPAYSKAARGCLISAPLLCSYKYSAIHFRERMTTKSVLTTGIQNETNLRQMQLEAQSSSIPCDSNTVCIMFNRVGML
jgi:hypothetical protein